MMANDYLHKIAGEISEMDSVDIYDFSTYFDNLQKNKVDHLGDKQEDTLRMFSGVCTFCLQSRQQYPYIPMMRMEGKRSMIPDDLSDGHLDILKKFAEEILPSVLMARICDVLWVRRKDHMMARKAISAYLECAEKGHFRNWPNAADGCRRAARIAKELGRKAHERHIAFEKIKALFDAASANMNNPETPLWANTLAEILIDECDTVDLADLGKSCDTLGDKITGVWAKEPYYELAIRAYEKAGQASERSQVYLKLGKCWEDDAKGFYKPDRGEGMQIAFRLQKAIEAYRKGGAKEKAEQLIKELQKANMLGISQMKKFEFKLDVTKLVADGVEQMKNKYGKDAITAFASLAKPPDYGHMIKQVKDQAGRYPLQHLMPSETVTVEGNISARSEGGLSEDGPDTLLSLVAQYNINRNVIYAILDSSRHVIVDDKAQRWKRGIQEVIRNHPLVPKEREDLILQSLVAGIEGDWIVFLHLIIPQLENIIRGIVGRAGGKTTAMKQGIMQEIDLNQLLKDDLAGKPQVVNVLGVNTVWDLRTLLVEQGGANLRNRVCHGLATSTELNSANAIYLLWLTLFVLTAYNS